MRGKVMRLAAAGAFAMLSLTVTSGTASASVWRCDVDTMCTTAAYDVGVYTVPDGAYKYTIPRGAVVEIVCYGYGDDNSVWYNGGREGGWASGWIPGDGLTTGHDPNPNIGYCS